MIRTLARRFLPNFLRYRLANFYYHYIHKSSAKDLICGVLAFPVRVARYALRRIWLKTASFRYLLHASQNSMNAIQRIQRILLKTFLALPDFYYRYRFAKFDRFLKLTPDKKIPRWLQGTAFFIGTLGPGGAERQLMLTVTGLAKINKNSKVRLYCQCLGHDWQRFFLGEIEGAGIPVHEMTWDLGQIGGDPAYFEKLAGIINVLPNSLIDVGRFLHALAADTPEVAHFWLDECNVKGGLAALGAGVPRIVLGLRSLPPCNFSLHQPWMREGYRYLAKQPGVVMLNNSISGARAYEKWLGLEPDTIQVVHNGFAFDDEVLSRYKNERESYRSRLGISSGTPVLGTVIRLSEEKRPLLWLEIAALIRKKMPEMMFLLVGDGVLRDEVNVRVSQPDLVNVVKILGHQREPLGAMAAMDMFLLTSRLEGLPNVLVEAQAMGLPVVTTNVGGASETVRHGVTGWVLEEDDDARSIANRIVKLFHDQEWRSRASQDAPNFVSLSFGVGRMIEETTRLYQS